MRSFIPSLVVAMAVVAAIAGCQSSSSTSSAPGAKVYDVKGKIVSLDAGKKVVTLDHEDIPGFMKAMTMEFAVADARASTASRPATPSRARSSPKAEPTL